MEELLTQAARGLGLALETLALVVVAVGATEAVVGIAGLLIERRTGGAEQRTVWLRFAHWLVAALTFQLAADIAQTTVAPDWDQIGRVGAIAAIRTFLTYFLDRDIDSVRELQRRPARQGVEADGV